MTYQLGRRIVGTSRISAENRTAFGDFLDGAGTDSRNALLTEGGSWVWEALRQNGRAAKWDICALVPHVAGYVREATDYGMLGAGWRRLRRMNPLSWFRLGFQGMLNARGVLRKDFPTLLVLLLELEMANFRKAHPAVVFLHPQITDLLLAMDHGKALERAVQRIRRGFGAEPGLASYNAGTLLPRLQMWGIEVPYLYTSLHPSGHGMRPTKESCEHALQTFGGEILANLDGELTPEIAEYWRAKNVTSAVYDAAEPTLQAWQGPWASWHPGARRSAESLAGVA
jgi:hypothetical protein